MFELQLTTAELKTIRSHQYYVFPAPPHHTNQTDRPTVYADVKVLKTYVEKAAKGRPRCIRM
jgi:hypothetical protein